MIEKFNEHVEDIFSSLSDDEIQDLKTDFFAKYGKVHPDESPFEQRMDYFHQHLICRERPENNAFLHSCFTVKKVRGDTAICLDLLDTRYPKLTISLYDADPLLQVGDIFQGFLFQTSALDYFLGRGLLFYPPSFLKYLKKTRKKLKNQEDREFVMRALAKAHLQYARSPNSKTPYYFLEKELEIFSK